MKLVLTVLVVLTVGFALTVTIPTGSARLQQSEKEIATPIREGVMTERQREHSRLYKEYKTEKKLRDINVPGTKDVRIAVGTGLPMGDPSAEPFNRNKFLRRLACDADAVVVGLVRDKTSQFTEEEGFIFSDYEVVVQEILKNNTTAPIQANESVIITRPGGAVRLDGRVFQAEDESFKPLNMNSRYVLFLRYLPATNAYRAVNSKAAFVLLNNTVHKLTVEWTGFEDENDAGRFLSDLHAAVLSCKEEKGQRK